jgi:lysophospholipase L1-like esterase
VFEKLASSLSPGDWVVIQFGHNEDKPDEARHTWPWTTFGENLAHMITRIRMKGAFPVLLSSIERRRFREGKAYDTLGEYPWAMAAVAVRLGVPFFDLTTPTLHLLDALGEEASRRLFNQGIWPNYPDGVEDNTHLSLYGASASPEWWRISSLRCPVGLSAEQDLTEQLDFGDCYNCQNLCTDIL